MKSSTTPSKHVIDALDTNEEHVKTLLHAQQNVTEALDTMKKS